MTDEPEVMIRDLLRTYISDPNPSRVVGTPFIIDDWPFQDNLTYNHFPRISIIPQFENDKPFGIGSSDFWSTYRLQIDIWCKTDQPLSIGGSEYEGIKQVIKLSRDVEEAIRINWISNLASTNKLIILESYNQYSPKIDYEFMVWRRTSDCTLKNIRN